MSSYYDYYQPEAYVPSSDTYIAKDSAINDEIDKLRLSATTALAERRDVIIVASVSCIYGLGSPVDYKNMVISFRPGMEKDRDEVMRKLVDIQYERNEMDFHRGTFRVRGDVLEIYPANCDDYAYRIEFFGDEIDRITEIDVLTGRDAVQPGASGRLPGLPLRCADGQDSPGYQRDRERTGRAGGLVQERGQAAGGAADCRADEL